MVKEIVTLKYNPYNLGETAFVLSSGKLLENILSADKKNRRLQDWIFPYDYEMDSWEGVLPRISKEIGRKSFTLNFMGREVDYYDIKTAIEMLDDGYSIDINYQNASESADKIEQLQELFKKIELCPIPQIKDEFEEALRDTLNGEFPVGIFGKMSCGKSTFINALVGEKILATSTEECTGKNYYIYDVDGMNTFEIHYWDSEKKEHVIDFSQLTPELLKSFNESGYTEIKAYGDVDFVDNDICKLVLIDTPGTGTKNEENSESAYKALNTVNGLKILVFDAAQVELEDTKNTLEKVVCEIKTNPNTSSENVFFVINKMDMLIDNDDDPKTKIQTVIDLLEEEGIRNPKVFPVNSLGAYATKSHIKNRKLNIGEKNKYNNLVSILDDEDCEKYNFYKYRPSVYGTVSEEVVKTLDVDEKALYYSGLRSIEQEIVKYIKKYAFPIKIENFYKTYLKLFEDESAYSKWISDKSEQIRIGQEELNKSQNIKSTQEMIKINAEKAIDLRGEVNIVKEENRKDIDRIRSYIQVNKGKIKDQIKGIVSKFSSSKGITSTIEIIMFVIGALVPGGYITFGLFGIVGRLFGFTGSSMDKEEKQKIQNEVNNGLLGELKNKFAEVEASANDRFKNLVYDANELLKPLNMSRSTYTAIDLSNIDLNINSYDLLKKTKKGFFKTPDPAKLEKILNEEMDRIVEEALNSFILEYRTQSKKILDDIYGKISKAERTLRRASDDITKAVKSINDNELQIKVISEEIEWMEAFKKELEAIVKIG